MHIPKAVKVHFGPNSPAGRRLITASHAGGQQMRALLKPVAILASYARLLGWGLLRAGFAVSFVPIILLLLLSGAGRDYMLAFAVDAHRWGWVGAVFWVALWVLTTWFWSQIALVSDRRVPQTERLSQDTQRRFVEGMRRWLATVIAFCSGVAVAGALLWIAELAPVEHAQQDAGAADDLKLAAAAVLAATVAVLVLARLVARRLSRLWRSAELVILWRWIVFVTGGVILAYFLIATAADPVGTSHFWGGALNLALIAAMAWIGNGTTLILLGDSWQVPLVAIVAVWMVFVSAISNQHRLTAANQAAPPRTLDAAYKTWSQRAPAAQGPLIIVATAGGGMRAAFWTATVLGRARDTVPGFDRALFAISGVSGGSVGAAVYSAMSAHGLQGCTASPATFELCGQQAITPDLLGPTLAAYLFTDILQGFIPTEMLRLNDRAHALESAIADGWSNAFGDGANPFGTPLDGLYDPSRAAFVPELLFNGTSVRTGARLITASVATPDGIFPAALDARNLYSIEPNLAEAAMNSARFPYVTPVASVGSGADADEIGDGGYFENFGAATAEDVLRWVRQRPDRPRRVIVVAISSDETLPDAPPFWVGSEKCDYAPAKTDSLGRILPQALAPLLALANGRSAHGILATWRLMRATLDVKGDEFIPFRLTRLRHEYGVPLSWALSGAGRARLRDELQQCPNLQAMQELRKALDPQQLARTP